jgi:hypothetical protein
MHVWNIMKEVGFYFLETWRLNQDPAKNTYGAIYWHCRTKCKDNGIVLLVNQNSLHRKFNSSLPGPSTSVALKSLPMFLVVHMLQSKYPPPPKRSGAVCSDDMKVFSVAHISKFIARQLLCGAWYDAYWACLIFQEMLSTSVFIYET